MTDDDGVDFSRRQWTMIILTNEVAQMNNDFSFSFLSFFLVIF